METIVEQLTSESVVNQIIDLVSQAWKLEKRDKHGQWTRGPAGGASTGALPRTGTLPSVRAPRESQFPISGAGSRVIQPGEREARQQRIMAVRLDEMQQAQLRAGPNKAEQVAFES